MKKILKKENGFSILAVILVIVAVVVAIGVWALSGQSNTSSNANGSIDVLVSSLVADSESIKMSYDNAVINGAVPLSLVNTPPRNGNSDFPIELPTVNPKFVTSDTKNLYQTVFGSDKVQWFLNPGQRTTDSELSLTAGLFGVDSNICKRINAIYNGSDSIPQLSQTSSAEDINNIGKASLICYHMDQNGLSTNVFVRFL